jgi:hypothetical protein
MTNTNDISDGYHTFGELYEHRAALFAALIHCVPHRAWMSRRHHDGSEFEGYFIAGLDLPTGQITYHVPEFWWGFYEFAGALLREYAPEWDGHTSAEVISRLTEWATNC